MGMACMRDRSALKGVKMHCMCGIASWLIIQLVWGHILLLC